MKEYSKNGIILCRHIKPSDFKEGLNFFSKDSEFIQVGVWKYNFGKELLAHVHNEVTREIQRTYETLYVINGQIEVTVFDIQAKLMDCFIAEKGDIVVLLESGHGYRILEDNTQVLEVKNGPYLGADVDRHRI